MPTRRDMIAGLAAALSDPTGLIARLAAQHACSDPDAGTLIDTLQLSRPDGARQPFGVKLGSGLDARLVTDLSELDSDRLITPTPLAFVRTDCPRAAMRRGRWFIRISGLGAHLEPLTADGLVRRARPMGAHLLECSGNNNPANFGLMSVAEWDGVPLADVVAPARPDARATAVLVRGVDHEGEASGSSIASASWVFPLASLERLGAFLAVRMNGEPMPLDHGRPVRLVVPGWYGCTWIKWVHEIRLVGADEPATSQMKEFAGRTHQTARHDRASDYSPADIQAAAMPVRVEKRRTPTGLVYRIVGIVWGGSKAVGRLAIRFSRDDAPAIFTVCPSPTTHAIWSLWDYVWTPPARGIYRITLTIPDSSTPQRRLDTEYYARDVTIEEH